ncbi:MAG TPA: alpha/beta hydrolase [Candidatus Binataceae bacterium]|nr:alpha/beta hydrolase [Candidatus Binataceae bacterium]
MARIHANGIDIEYEEFGPKTGTPVLLIMGLGAQLTRWPLEFIEILTSRGYRVIRYDNRDVGLSRKFDSAGPADVVKMMTEMAQGKKPSVAYTLEDMANDAAGLLDALQIDKAHIVGASLGGAIGQLVAANHPGKTLSLTSIMSSTSNSALPPAKPEAMAVLLNRPPAGDVEATIEFGVKAYSTIGSPGYPTDEKEIRRRVAEDFKRSNYPAGFTRQMAAALVNGDRRAALKRIKAPTVVIHGKDDPLVPIEAGRDTAANIAGAELIEIPGMGHDLPAALYSRIVDAIESVAKRARVGAP